MRVKLEVLFIQETLIQQASVVVPVLCPENTDMTES